MNSSRTVTSENLARIRDLTIKPGSIARWVQERMEFPCEPALEAKRLFNLPEKPGSMTLVAIYRALLYILQRADLYAVVLAEGLVKPRQGPWQQNWKKPLPKIVEF